MNYGYIRVSTDKQDLNNQLQEIIGHCKSKGLKLNSCWRETKELKETPKFENLKT